MPGPGQALPKLTVVRTGSSRQSVFEEEKKTEFMNMFPLSENLHALLFYCLADLDKNQRETFETIMSTQNLEVKDYTFELLRKTFMKHFASSTRSAHFCNAPN